MTPLFVWSLPPHDAPLSSRRGPHGVVTGLLALAVGLALAAPLAAQAQAAAPSGEAPANKQDYSEAERLLFMGKQMARLKPPTTLRYVFRKSGSLEEAFEDKVTLSFKRMPNGNCCAVTGEFLTGARRLDLPQIDDAEANPVLLYFLERDIREMKRITQGNPNYYRKRIRMSAYEGAKVTPVTVRYKDAAVSARQIDLSPYADDPARSRYEKYARKTYRFVVSDAVPGGVAGMRSLMQAESADAPPLIVEELFLDGVELPATSPAR